MSISLTYHGHSTFGLDVDGMKLIIDPWFLPDEPSCNR